MLFSTVSTLVRELAGNSPHPPKTQTQNLTRITGLQGKVSMFSGVFFILFFKLYYQKCLQTKQSMTVYLIHSY